MVALTIVLIAGSTAFGVWWQRNRTLAASYEQRLLMYSAGGRRDVTAKDLNDLIAAPGIEIARGADRVEFLKIAMDAYGSEPWTVANRVAGTPAQLAAARDVLLSPDVYSYEHRGGHKKCGGFQPRDVVRFWRGRESVTFLICFTCKDVAVVTHNADGGAKPYIIADSRNGDARLRGVIESAFPGTLQPPD